MQQVPHNRLTFNEEQVAHIASVVRSGQWACGPRVAELEALLAQRAHVPHAVCVASGLSALRLALLATGVKRGDTVLVPAYSCVALANAVLACEAKPIPVDIARGTCNVCPDAVRQAAKAYRPKALVLVHTFGLPVAVEPIRDGSFAVIEDCAHAFGIAQNLRPLGSRGDAAVLSFYATKLIGAGEGGAVLTRSRPIADFVRTWRDYANQEPDGTRLNDKMTDLEAALALCQIERLDATIAARHALAMRYHERLEPAAARTGAFILPPPAQDRIWYRYALELTTPTAHDVVAKMKQRGIHAERPVVDWRPKDTPPCPTADSAYERIVSLPLFPTLSLEEQERVVAAFLDVCPA